MRFFYLTVIGWLIAAPFGNAQSWVGMMADSTKSFYEIKTAFEEHWQGREITRGSGWKQFQRWAWYMEPRVYPHGNRIPVSQAYHERQNFMQNYGVSAQRSSGWVPLGPADWTTVSSGYNPGIGRVNVVAEHPTNSSILYAGAPAGGLWKSIDGGSSWQPLTDHFPTLGVSGIAIDYTNPDVIYISTGDMDGFDTYSIGVMKSIDGGITWQPTGLVHTLNQNRVCRKLVMHPTNPQILLVATSSGLHKTSDGGTTWSQVANGSFRDIEFKPGDPTTVYASTNRFFLSTNTGDSFVIVSNGLPATSTINRMEIAVSPEQPNWVYALGGKSGDASFLGLWRSTDGGLTFQLRADSPNLFGYSETGNDDAGQSWFDMALDVSRTDANTVLVGGVNVWRSTNGGSTFNIVSHWVYPSFTGYTHADIHTLHYFNGNLYCGSDGGLYKSTNNGTTWTDLTPGMEITQFYRLGLSSQEPYTIMGGAQDNGSNLFKNNDWTHVLGADGMEAAISPTNPNVMFCTWQFGGIHRTTDGGNNWNFIFDGDGEDGGWVTPYLSLPGNVLIAGYQNVWRSTNNGTSFNQISNFSSGASIRDIAVCKTNQNYIYVSFSGSIHRTTNGGTSWQNITANLPSNTITDIQVHPNNPDVVWVSLSGFSNGNKVFVTTNGGSSWQNISQNLPNIPCNAIVYQEGSNGGLYVGMDVGIYYTDSTLSN